MEIVFLLCLLIGALMCAYASRVIAERRGWPTLPAALTGFLLGPIGVLVAAASPVNAEARDDELVRTGDARRCMSCRTVVPREATRCRACREELPPPRARR